MRYFSHSWGGLTRADMALLEAGKVKLKNVGKKKKEFLVLAQRGTIHHSAQCYEIQGKRVETRKLSILEVAEVKTHAVCTRWAWMQDPDLEKIQPALWVATVQSEVDEIAGSDTPAHERAARLLEEVEDGKFNEAVLLVDNGTQRVDQLRKQLYTLREEWSSISSQERSLKFVAGSLNFPRESLAALGSSPSHAWRMTKNGWEKWRGSLLAERSQEASRLLVHEAVAADVKRMNRRGEGVEAPTEQQIDLMVDQWEAEAKTACAEEEGDIIIAAYGWRYLNPHSPLHKILATYPSASNQESAVAVAKCPAAVADWLHDQLSGRTDHIHWLGEAEAGDNKAVLETLTGVWNPSEKTELADVRKALETARTLTTL